MYRHLIIASILALSCVMPVRSASLFPLGDLWSYSDTNTDLSATAWTTYFYNDSAWASSYARFGNGNVVVSTALTAGPSTARYITYYFRKKFNSLLTSSVQLNATVSLRAVDGAVVYINGGEVGRINMPTGNATITGSTLAATCISTATTVRETLYTISVPPGVISPSDNVIAVELHRCKATTSLTLFDLSVDYDIAASPSPTPYPAPPATQLDFGGFWSYKDDGSDQSATTWRTTSVTGLGWPSARAPLYVGTTSPAGTSALATASNGFVQPSYYFRADVPLTVATGIKLYGTLTVTVDDGAIVYVNNKEVGRVNMPSGVTSSFYLAASSPSTSGGAAVPVTAGIALPPGTLVNGNNMLAIEIHQAAPNASTTAFFDAKLEYLALPTPSPSFSKTPTVTRSMTKTRTPSINTTPTPSSSATDTVTVTVSMTGSAIRSFSTTPSVSRSPSRVVTQSGSRTISATTSTLPGVSASVTPSAQSPSPSPSLPTSLGASTSPAVSASSAVSMTPSPSVGTSASPSASVGGTAAASSSPSASQVVAPASATASISLTPTTSASIKVGSGNTGSSNKLGSTETIIVAVASSVAIAVCAGVCFISVSRCRKERAHRIAKRKELAAASVPGDAFDPAITPMASAGQSQPLLSQQPPQLLSQPPAQPLVQQQLATVPAVESQQFLVQPQAAYTVASAQDVQLAVAQPPIVPPIRRITRKSTSSLRRPPTTAPPPQQSSYQEDGANTEEFVDEPALLTEPGLPIVSQIMEAGMKSGQAVAASPSRVQRTPSSRRSSQHAVQSVVASTNTSKRRSMSRRRSSRHSVRARFSEASNDELPTTPLQRQHPMQLPIPNAHADVNPELTETDLEHRSVSVASSASSMPGSAVRQLQQQVSTLQQQVASVSTLLADIPKQISAATHASKQPASVHEKPAMPLPTVSASSRAATPPLPTHRFSPTPQQRPSVEDVPVADAARALATLERFLGAASPELREQLHAQQMPGAATYVAPPTAAPFISPAQASQQPSFQPQHQQYQQYQQYQAQPAAVPAYSQAYAASSPPPSWQQPPPLQWPGAAYPPAPAAAVAPPQPSVLASQYMPPVNPQVVQMVQPEPEDVTVQTLIPGVKPVAFVPQADGSVIGYAPLSHLPRMSPTRSQYEEAVDHQTYDIIRVQRPERGRSPRRARSPVPPVVIDVNPEHDSTRQERGAYQSSGWRFRFPFTSRRRSSSREGSVRSPRRPARRTDSQDAVEAFVARPKTVWL